MREKRERRTERKRERTEERMSKWTENNTTIPYTTPPPLLLCPSPLPPSPSPPPLPWDPLRPLPILSFFLIPSPLALLRKISAPLSPPLTLPPCSNLTTFNPGCPLRRTLSGNRFAFLFLVFIIFFWCFYSLCLLFLDYFSILSCIVYLHSCLCSSLSP